MYTFSSSEEEDDEGVVIPIPPKSERDENKYSLAHQTLANYCHNKVVDGVPQSIQETEEFESLSDTMDDCVTVLVNILWGDKKDKYDYGSKKAKEYLTASMDNIMFYVQQQEKARIEAVNKRINASIKSVLN